MRKNKIPVQTLVWLYLAAALLAACTRLPALTATPNPTLASTDTPTPTSTTTATPNPTNVSPTITPSISAQATLPIPSLGKSVSIISRSQDKINIFNGDLELINSFPDLYQYLFLSTNGQNLFEVTSWFEIGEIDFSGKPIQTKQALTTETDYTHNFHLMLSPDHDWIAYLNASGELGRGLEDAEFRNIKLININFEDKVEPLQLTQYGVARSAASSWSPNSRYFAFSDRDELNQTSQIFIYDVVLGQRIQLTNFESESQSLEIVTLSWSSDSKYLAYEMADHVYDKYGDHYDHFRIGVLDILTSEIIWIDSGTDGSKIRVWSMHWQNSNPVVLILIEVEDHMQLVWYDVDLNTVKKVQVICEDPVYEAFLMDNPTRVLLIGDNFFLAYDETTDKFFKKANETALMRPEVLVANSTKK